MNMKKEQDATFKTNHSVLDFEFVAIKLKHLNLHTGKFSNQAIEKVKKYYKTKHSKQANLIQTVSDYINNYNTWLDLSKFIQATSRASKKASGRSLNPTIAGSKRLFIFILSLFLSIVLIV